MAALIILLLMLTDFGEASINKPVVVTVQDPNIKENQKISKVDLKHCCKDISQVSTDDPDFGVKPDGYLFATRALRISEQRSFNINLQDSLTLVCCTIQVHLLIQPNLQHELKELVRAKRAVLLRRQKRRWRPLPFSITENDIGPFPKYVQTIRSEYEQNYTLFYKITGEGVDRPPLGFFRIEPETGKIFVLRTVDREEYPSFSLTGTAKTKEGFVPEYPLSLTVKVNDVNDNIPTFNEETFVAKVAEGSPVGTSFFKLTATDLDEPNTLNTLLRYKILSQEPGSKFGQLFSVDERTGELKTKTDKLDREEQDTYTLTVEVRDMEGKPYGLFSTGTVVVHVADVNDHTPTFKTNKYMVWANESVSDVMILRMPIDDEDMKDTNASRAVFTIVNGDNDGNFKVITDPKTNEGLLYIVKPLDCEKTPKIPLEIAVENAVPLTGSSASRQTASVMVNVANVDEGPEFEPAVKQIWTKENVEIGHLLDSYVAKDPETRSSDGIRYRKLSDPAGWVSIDSQTGEIRTTAVLDRESEFVKNNKYNVTVLAIEDRAPGRTGTGTVVINLDDVNDHIPLIHNNQLYICENGQRQFVNVSAEDSDIAPNSAPFTFLLPDEPPEIKNKWTITNQMGTYAFVKPVNKLPPGYYEVPVTIQDQQHQGKEQTLKITICECPNNINCAGRLASGSAVLGGMGILVMLLAALLLLCLLLAAVALYCGGGKVPQPVTHTGQYQQNLLVSNDEGGGQQDKNLDALDITLHQKGQFATENVPPLGNQETGFGQQTQIPSVYGSGVQGPHFGTTITDEMVNITGGGIYDESVGTHHTLHLQNDMMHQDLTTMDGYRLDRRNSHHLMDLLRSRVDQVYEDEELRDQAIHGDLVHDYRYEGAPSVNGSVGCCSDVRENMGQDYLNDLGPKFGTLASMSLKR
ncbi:desmocollin-2-like [Hemiscyllium ocellatum]|uniref:desmocollin-2-like n=1 Tax=Hemiscyllium ocellatum TaxID=170820 RepID=UPI002966507C|nr:desmocollin-2-like [Hemiscyllium ocellatum]